MTGSATLAVVVTVVFAATGVGYLIRSIVDGHSGVGRVSDLLHVLMSVAMLSMPWGWGMVFPTTLQEIVFGLATVFYIVLVIGRPSASSATDVAATHHSGRRALAFHAVMMAAMVFMAVQMSGAMSGGASMSMPGMDMSGGSTVGVDAYGPAWRVLDWALVVFFALAAIRYVTSLVRPVRRGDRVVASGAVRVNATLLLLMSAGMALAFLPA